jgi:hypothetical protein
MVSVLPLNETLHSRRFSNDSIINEARRRSRGRAALYTV